LVSKALHITLQISRSSFSSAFGILTLWKVAGHYKRYLDRLSDMMRAFSLPHMEAILTAVS
jgi:hypothetical protein